MSFFLAAIVAATLGTTTLPPAFTQGETLDYNLTWLRITGGTARMTIAPADDDRFRITSIARSSTGFSRIFRVRDEIESIVARSDFSTLRYTKHLDEEGDQKREVTTIVDGVATRVRKKTSQVHVPRPIYDPISVIFLLRTLDLTVGKTHEVTLVADGKLYTVHAHVSKKDTIQTPAGTFNTVVVEPEMISGGVPRAERLFIWYSDDERRIPVRVRTEVKFGAVTANLRAIARGVQSTEPPVLVTK